MVAVEHEQMSAAQWLFDHEASVDTVGAMHKALKCNNIEMLQWLHDHYDENCRYWMMRQRTDWPPASSVLRWLLDHYPDRYQARSAELREMCDQGDGSRCSVQ